MCDIAINVLVEEVAKGRKLDNGFHRDAYNAVAKEIKEKVGINITKDNIYHKYKQWRKDVLAVRNFRFNCTGFGWDDSKEMVVAEDSIWDDYFKTHRQQKVWQNKRVRRYDELDVIVGKDTASGKNAKTGVDGPIKETQSQPIDDYYPNLDGLSEFSSADVEELVYGDMRTPESVRKDVPESIRKGATGTAESKLSSIDQRSTRKRKANDDAVGACDNLTKVIEKLATTLEMDNEFTRAKVLKEAIKSVKGINREEVSAAFQILIQDKFKALDFWTTEEDERMDFLRSLLYS